MNQLRRFIEARRLANGARPCADGFTSADCLWFFKYFKSVGRKNAASERLTTHYEEALPSREAELGRDHPNVATILNELANRYLYQDEDAKAEAHYQRALAIQEAKLGNDHPDVARTFDNLALVYEAQGNYRRPRRMAGVR